MTLPDLLLFGLGIIAGVAIDAGAARYARAGPWEAARWPALATALAGGLVAAAAAVWAPPGMVAISAVFGWLLLALAAIDLRTFLLPDALNAAVLGLGGLMVWISRPESWLLHAGGAALGYGLLWSVEGLYRRLRGRDGLGRGDAKLLGAIGMWVGLTGIPAVLLAASLSGIAAALVQAVLRRQPLSGQSAIAFGPWIALGGFAVWLAQAQGVGLAGA